MGGYNAERNRTHIPVCRRLCVGWVARRVRSCSGRQEGATLRQGASAGAASSEGSPPARRLAVRLLLLPAPWALVWAAYMGGMSGKPSFLPCLLMRDLCCGRAGGGGDGTSVFAVAGQQVADVAGSAACNTQRTHTMQPPWRHEQRHARQGAGGTHDVGDDAAAGDGRLDEGVQLLVTADSKLHGRGGAQPQEFEGSVVGRGTRESSAAGRRALCRGTYVRLAGQHRRRCTQPRIATPAGSELTCKWRGVIRFTLRSLEALPASSSTCRQRFERGMGRTRAVGASDGVVVTHRLSGPRVGLLAPSPVKRGLC